MMSINLEGTSVGCHVLTLVAAAEKTSFMGSLTLCEIFCAATKFFILSTLTSWLTDWSQPCDKHVSPHSRLFAPLHPAMYGV